MTTFEAWLVWGWLVAGFACTGIGFVILVQWLLWRKKSKSDDLDDCDVENKLNELATEGWVLKFVVPAFHQYQNMNPRLIMERDKP